MSAPMTPEQIEAIKGEVMTLEYQGGLWVCAEDYLAEHEARLAAEAERDTLAAQVEALRAVKVKPLEWLGRPDDCYMFSDTDLGIYEIGVEYGDEWFCDFTSHRSGRPVRLSNCQDGPIAPQAAAQADYEARILTALEARHG